MRKSLKRIRAEELRAARLLFPQRMTPRRKLELLAHLREIHRVSKDRDPYGPMGHVSRSVKAALKICTGF